MVLGVALVLCLASEPAVTILDGDGVQGWSPLNGGAGFGQHLWSGRPMPEAPAPETPEQEEEEEEEQERTKEKEEEEAWEDTFSALMRVADTLRAVFYGRIAPSPAALPMGGDSFVMPSPSPESVDKATLE
tara:strand:- start:3348 stop:3740 length:393 start_codon:yes stop_codon:yes gene_type:complete